MILSWDTTQRIIGELYEMLRLPVCLADLNGRIITEDGPGDIHGGAVERLSRYAAGDMTAGDSSDGVSVLTVGDRPVGVLIVEGLQRERQDQLFMAKRLAELLIRTDLLEQQERLHAINRRDLVKQWIFNDFVSEDNTFETCAMIAGLDISGRYVVGVLQVLSANEHALDEEMMRKIGQAVSQHTPQMTALIGEIMVESKVIFLFGTENAVMVQRVLAALKRILESGFSVSVSGGIGPASCDYRDVHGSYEKAEKACSISFKSRGTAVMRYEELSIDLLVEEIPAQIKTDFVSKVFANCKKSDVDEWKVLLRTFFTQSGSIGKTAEMLYIHKNTLQYKLNKIKEQTGYDPRNTCDALKLYIAILFDSGQHY